MTSNSPIDLVSSDDDELSGVDVQPPKFTPTAASAAASKKRLIDAAASPRRLCLLLLQLLEQPLNLRQLRLVDELALVDDLLGQPRQVRVGIQRLQLDPLLPTR